ncbi:MAG: hypothetical protein JNK15_14585 [Planctomycetes bacterium]|nr:hypothetical protein [Planctomycetota bacterium]
MFEKLLAFLLREPLILVVVGAWLIGMVGGIVKAMKQARERAERARQLPRESDATGLPPMARVPAPPPPAPVATPPVDRSPEALAREMRRILGIEPAPAEAKGGDRSDADEARAGDVAPRESDRGDAGPVADSTPPPLPSGTMRRRNVAEPERAPVPVVPTTNRRRLEIHVAPHVGESIGRRASPQSGRVGSHSSGSELGNLGGRGASRARQRSSRSRYPLTDLKRILVLNEILGPPLALRRNEREV